MTSWMFPSKVGSPSNIYSFELSKSWDIWEFLYCEVFCRCHCLWDVFDFWRPLSSFLPVRLPSLSSSCCLAGLPHGDRVPIPMLCCFFPDSIHVLLKFYFQHYHSSFLCHAFSFFGQFPLSMIHFGKMSRGFFTRREGSNTTTCFAICVWPEWQVLSDLSLIDFERRDMIGHWLWCAPVISVVIGGLKR